MNLFEFENQQFPGLWNKKTIKELQLHKPHRRNFEPLFECEDEHDNEHDIELYREFQQANFEEYFTPMYRICIYGK